MQQRSRPDYANHPLYYVNDIKYICKFHRYRSGTIVTGEVVDIWLRWWEAWVEHFQGI